MSGKNALKLSNSIKLLLWWANIQQGNTVYIRLPTPTYSQKAGFKPCFKGPMHSILALAFITKTRSKAMYHLDVLGNIEVGRAWKHASQEVAIMMAICWCFTLRVATTPKMTLGKTPKYHRYK